MTLLTMRQAADTVGVSRLTIYRKVDEGVLSTTTNLSDRSKGADTSELIRVFEELKPRHEKTTLDSPEVVADRLMRQEATRQGTTTMRQSYSRRKRT